MGTKRLKVLAVCGGNGVICHPFKDNLIANIEPRTAFKTPGNVQWTANFGKIPIFTSLEAFIKVFTSKPDVDVLIGAPDCGHSSVLSYSRLKGLSNPRDNKSLTMFLQSIKMFNPTIFMMENLPAMLKTISKSELQEFFGDYKLIFHEASVSEWGNSQKTRIRLVLVGLKKGENLKKAFFKIKPMGAPQYAGELLKGLVYGENGHFREDIDTKITLYAGKKMTLREIQQEWLKRGVSRWEVNDRVFLTAPGVYLNLANRFPSTARKANRQFNHEGLMMSPRELARIQGVPDSFIIHFEENRLGFWINKGRVSVTKCPPYEIGLWLRACISKWIKVGITSPSRTRARI